MQEMFPLLPREIVLSVIRALAEDSKSSPAPQFWERVTVSLMEMCSSGEPVTIVDLDACTIDGDGDGHGGYLHEEKEEAGESRRDGYIFEEPGAHGPPGGLATNEDNFDEGEVSDEFEPFEALDEHLAAVLGYPVRDIFYVFLLL
jgi:hypothetical protein